MDSNPDHRTLQSFNNRSVLGKALLSDNLKLSALTYAREWLPQHDLVKSIRARKDEREALPLKRSYGMIKCDPVPTLFRLGIVGTSSDQQNTRNLMDNEHEPDEQATSILRRAPVERASA